MGFVMITRRFKWAEDKEHGGEGWIPDFIPNANAARGFALVHDALEHGDKEKGTYECEMKAMGAMIYVRLLGGWFYRTMSRYSGEENIAFDISRMLCDIGWHRDLKEAPRTRVVGYDIGEELEEIIRCVKKDWRNNEYDSLDTERLLLNIKRAIGWMRLGFVQAKRRFHNAPPYQMESLFEDIKQKVEGMVGEWGAELVIKVNPKNLSFRAYTDYPEYEY